MTKWDDMEQWMKTQQLPRGFDALKDTGWVANYVKSMMADAIQEKGKLAGQNAAETFETHHFIVIKWPIPRGVHPSELRLLVREDKVRIEGLPEGKKDTVPLAKQVLPRSCKALCKDGILQIKLRKKPANRQYYEMPIRW
ncbi:Hsp20/alpha crystallin family protein [Paenibacillus kobensis]|jgi:HSP20 family molecular chaperone IbpA|uniref:Hsp20/alpha crystallin family protein n=1 Tax=Paenibacillus kobensis TaxID=59841 RepID=UPI000FD71715|nr:Hsp20/alpha crystallin family protein [Paenibacillus kobensis]